MTLHKTVGELLDTMTMTEYATWGRYFEERELERKRAENKRNGVIDFSDPEAGSQLIAMVNNGGGGPRPPRPPRPERQGVRK